LFRRPVPAAAPLEPREQRPSPYLDGRAEWDGQFGTLARSKRTWQVAAGCATGLLTLVTVAYVRLAETARVVPYVVQVDRLGQVQAVAPAERMRTPDARLVGAQLAEWVRRIRTVLPAAAAQAQTDLLRRGYAMTGGDAVGVLNAYFTDPAHDPRVIGRTAARQVDVTSALPVPNSAGPNGTTWRLRWTETDTPLGVGGIPVSAAYEAYATVRLIPPATAEGVTDNPLGLVVTALSWTRTSDAPSAVPTASPAAPVAAPAATPAPEVR
jgi:type IV secretion system protein VirB5